MVDTSSGSFQKSRTLMLTVRSQIAQDPDRPVGLVNLGSTCYVNVVLQTLFAIRPFRQAVYAAEAPLSDDPVVKELR